MIASDRKHKKETKYQNKITLLNIKCQ